MVCSLNSRRLPWTVLAVVVALPAVMLAAPISPEMSALKTERAVHCARACAGMGAPLQAELERHCASRATDACETGFRVGVTTACEEHCGTRGSALDHYTHTTATGGQEEEASPSIFAIPTRLHRYCSDLAGTGTSGQA